ncbi:MAG TPA: ABC transporter permease subunit [Thermoanaerobaculia bacterium]|nr:ABC transporter permease subunit [Thermoanaerobaculia bacterium]
MRFLLVNVEEVFREAAARWTLIAYFLLSSLFILIFALSINLDIVDGALAGAKLFGQSVDMAGERVDLDRLVLGFEASFSAFLYLLGTFLAIFATAHLVPRLQDKGTIDLYLSRPVGRVSLLLSRYVAGLVLAGANVLYLVGAIWLIVIWKTRVVHPQFMLGAAVIVFTIAALLAFVFLIGTITSSTAVSIMTSYALFFVSAVLVAHDKIEAAVDSIWSARLVHALWMIFPKTSDLGRATVALVSGGQAPQEISAISAWPFVSTAIFALACLTLASWVFTRKEF